MAQEITSFVGVNPTSGLMVFKTYIDTPGVFADSYAATGDAVNTQAGTTYTLTQKDNGKIVAFTSGSAITLTVPSGLGKGFSCSIVQYGAGQVTISAGAGVTLRLRASANKTAAQYAVVSLLSVVANEHIVVGDASA